ncbi:transmembrane protein 223 [Pantherophis guttatus]|uniref:Transmembrane protein 223 n=1 Tax=Pantherophis guttatus TaxID=94885 RepID=A0A6P9CEG2_PANGU|nr:transmembrane protein 223 [Pantherophis guttatus]
MLVLMLPRCAWASLTWTRVGFSSLLRGGLQSARLGVLPPFAKQLWSPSIRRAQEPFPLDGFVNRDVELFHHERSRFFRNVGLFCLSQFAFWLYLADLAFTTLRETTAVPEKPGSSESPERPPAPTRPWLGNLFNLTSGNFGSAKWRYGFSATCVTVGTLIFVAGFFFARRSVSRILLLRGSQEVTFTTYYLFGYTSSFTVPLRHICCMSHRSEVAAIIPVKIKGKPFYFLLDKQGSITNNPLFDITVGAYREW